MVIVIVCVSVSVYLSGEVVFRRNVVEVFLYVFILAYNRPVIWSLQ